MAFSIKRLPALTVPALRRRLGHHWLGHHWLGHHWLGHNWLVLPLALPLFLALGLATGTAINLGLSGDWIGRQDTGRLAAAERSIAGLPGNEVCSRIQHIVETACGLKQHDHDAGDIRACVARELKYTMWSPYGCR